MKTIKTVFSLLFACIGISSFAQDTIQLKAYVENMKTIDVFIEGKKYNFLFDTGGADTFISPEIAKSLNKEIYGCITGFRMSGEIIKAKKANDIELTIGKTNLFHKTVSVWDLMTILPKDFPRIDGIISLKSFERNVLTIDLSKNIVIVENKNSAKKKVKGKLPLKTRFANGLEGSELNIFFGVPKDKNLYWFLFDSGNSGPLLLSQESAEIWKVQNEKNQESEFIIGEKKLRIKPFVRDIIYDGVLNFEAISNYVFTIDFKNKEVWVN